MGTISIIGAGGMAAAIAGLATRAGYSIEVMSRDATRASALADQIGTAVAVGTFGKSQGGASLGMRRQGVQHHVFPCSGGGFA